MSKYGKKAMWSQPDNYCEAASAEQEAALRAEGWIDGKEYWAAKNAGRDPFASQTIAAEPKTEMPVEVSVSALEATAKEEPPRKSKKAFKEKE